MVIPGRAEYLPWRLSETPPKNITKEKIKRINIRYVKTILLSFFLKLLNTQNIEDIKITTINNEIKNKKVLIFSLIRITSKFKSNISKINFGILEPKKALTTVLYTKLIGSYFEKSNMRAVFEDPISTLDADITINDNWTIENKNKIKKQIKLYLFFCLR